MKRFGIYLLTLSVAGFLPVAIIAQTGGTSTFDFLNLPNSARNAALGGNFLAIADDDVTLAYANPSLITPEMHNHLALSFVDYFSDINYGYASYVRSFGPTGTFAGTLHFIDYGKFVAADPTDQLLGNFTAQEMALNIGWGRSLDSNFSIGANFKGIYSAFESYTSTGLAVDVAASYTNPEARFTVSLIVRNAGIQLTTYRPGDREPLPFEVAIGVSKRLEHVPLRFSILATQLQKWDLTYEDESATNSNGLTDESKSSGLSGLADKLMRHVVLGAELQPTRALSFRVGYNYQRRQQLKVESKMSTVGFSWGIGLRVSKFQFNYARSNDHLAGSPNYITITTNLGDFFGK